MTDTGRIQEIITEENIFNDYNDNFFFKIRKDIH